MHYHADDLIRPSHPGIGYRRSTEYLRGFEDGKGVALDAVKGYYPDGPAHCPCEVCTARGAAFYLLVGKIYAVRPQTTIEELRDAEKRLELWLAPKGGI